MYENPLEINQKSFYKYIFLKNVKQFLPRDINCTPNSKWWVGNVATNSNC